MPQLQIPYSIWISSSPSEKDQYFLSAGFDPNMPTFDNGTDAQFVRWRQDPPFDSFQEGVGFQPGDDIRDEPTGGVQQPVPVPTAIPAPIGPLTALDVGIVPTIGSVALVGRLPAPIRQQATTWLASYAPGGQRLAWGTGIIPTWLQTAMTGIGLGGAAIIVETLTPDIDIPFIPSLPGIGLPEFLSPSSPMGGTPAPFQGVQIVGKPWVANGVTFYRLSDGKLAVQNKKGRWKVWRPKRPIVLYADGASNLKTMLRADKALNKQAKKIAAMLNRRAPRRKSRSDSSTTPIILGNNARVVDV